MDKVQEFRRRANECRGLAGKSTSAEIRKNYEDLATVWERLAEERLGFFIPAPEAAAE